MSCNEYLVEGRGRMVTAHKLSQTVMSENFSLRPQTSGFGRQESELEKDVTDEGQEEKHPLKDKWGMLWDNSGSKFNNNAKMIGEFDTVENFWNLFNNLASPVDLHGKSNKYFLFKTVPFIFYLFFILVNS
jgi:hypothetical protein